MQNYTIINGYMVKNPNDKEELLDVLINVMSQKAMVVNYSLLRKMTCEELLNKLKTFDKHYNAIVYEYDLEHNCTIHKAYFSDDKRGLEYCGKTIIIESIQSFIENINERKAEGNNITSYEKLILKEIEGKGT